jgi:hypothetical protein
MKRFIVGTLSFLCLWVSLSGCSVGEEQAPPGALDPPKMTRPDISVKPGKKSQADKMKMRESMGR